MREAALLRKIRGMVLFFMVALLISGITAFPVYTELTWLKNTGLLNRSDTLSLWLNKVYEGVAATQTRFPFLFYGFDWLAFAHLMIAALFVGVYKHPVRNRFIIQWAMFCCIAIIPLAFICGYIRGIPLLHIIIDCSFGVFGILPLLLCQRWIQQLESLK